MRHRALLSTWAICCIFASAAWGAKPPQAKQGTANVNAKTPAEKMLVYIGTYTRGASQGIYCFQLDLASGKLSPAAKPTMADNPSFLALHPNGRFLYAANELSKFGGKPGGAISAFAIEAGTGALKLLNQQPSGGGAPCHLVVDQLGKHVLAANYSGGSVCVLPIEEGALGAASAFVQHHGSSVNPQRQKAPHAHSINLDKANRFALVADLGLDQILVYRYDTQAGTLKPNDPPFAELSPGSGPRHLAFHPSGRWAYVINEIASTVTAFSYDATRGALTELQTLTTLPKGFEGKNSTAQVVAHPNGKFLYGSNRGHNSIAIFRIDDATGRLTAAGHQPSGGKIPRNFEIDPTGALLLAANQDSDNVVVFRIDAKSGGLAPTGNEISVPAPVCVKFLAH